MTLLEWPERIEDILPARTIVLRIEHKGEEERLISITYPDA